MNRSVVSRAVGSLAACGLAVAATCCVCDSAAAQFVTYGVLRPVVAAPVIAAPVMAAPTYVANYFPSGNYAAVTAYSPPVVAAPMEVAVRTAYSPVIAPPVAVAAAMPTVAYYAPAVAAPVVAAPVTTYYAPAAVAMPLYRRGPFGGLRPVRSAYFISY